MPTTTSDGRTNVTHSDMLTSSVLDISEEIAFFIARLSRRSGCLYLSLNEICQVPSDVFVNLYSFILINHADGITQTTIGLLCDTDDMIN